MTAFVDDAHEFFHVRRVCLRIMFRGIALFCFSCDTHALICQFAMKIFVVEQRIFLQYRELALYQLWDVLKSISSKAVGLGFAQSTIKGSAFHMSSIESISPRVSKLKPDLCSNSAA